MGQPAKLTVLTEVSSWASWSKVMMGSATAQVLAMCINSQAQSRAMRKKADTSSPCFLGVKDWEAAS